MCSCGLRLLWLSETSDTDHPSQTEYEFILEEMTMGDDRSLHSPLLFLVSLFLSCPAPSFMLTSLDKSGGIVFVFWISNFIIILK